MLSNNPLLAAVGFCAMACVGGVPDVAFAEPTSYVLMCQGGGLMTYIVELDHAKIRIDVSFRKAPAAGSASPPKPGFCTWIDRPISQAEPSYFELTAPGDYAKVTCTMLPDRCAVNGLPSAPQELIRAIRNRTAFQVHAYNDGKGRFIVTRVGP